MPTRSHLVARSLLTLAICCTAVGTSSTARAGSGAGADSKFHRRGMQSTLFLGASMCVPSPSRCQHPTGEIQVDTKGRPRPLFGVGKEIGYRIPWLFIGASYSFGLMSPRWDQVRDLPSYRRAYQHNVLGVIRPTLPVWRFDFGATVAPGWSRQVFRYGDGRDKDYTQGFVLGTGAVVAFYLTRKASVGVRSDFLFNFHRAQCARLDDEVACQVSSRDNVPPVDQLMVGAYLSHMW